jgi:hypothetical protein
MTMRRSLARFLAAATLAAGLGVVGPPSPASAHEDVCAGVLSNATTSAPFFYPGVSLSKTVAAFAFTLGATGVCAPSLGDLNVSGIVEGYCGLSSGRGTAFGHEFAWTGVGGFLVLQGGAQGIVNASPNAFQGESCFSGADNFLIQGAWALTVHCTSKTKVTHKTQPLPTIVVKVCT